MELSTIETMSGHPKKQFIKNNWHYVTNNIFNDTNYGFNNHGHFLRNRPLNFLSRVKPGHSKQLQHHLTSKQAKQKELFRPVRRQADAITSPQSRAPPTPVQNMHASYSPEPVLRQNQPLLEQYEVDRFSIPKQNEGRKLSQAAHNVIHKSLKFNELGTHEKPQIGGAKYSLPHPYFRNPYQNTSSLTPRLLPDINRSSHQVQGGLPQIKVQGNPLIRKHMEFSLGNGLTRNSFINKMRHPKLKEFMENGTAGIELNQTDIVRSSVPYKVEGRHSTLDTVPYQMEQSYATVEKEEGKSPTQEYALPEAQILNRQNGMLHQTSGESLVNFEEKRHSGPADISNSRVFDFPGKQTRDSKAQLNNEESSRNKFFEVALHDLQNRGESVRRIEMNGEGNGMFKKDEKLKQKNQYRQVQRLGDQEFKDVTIGKRADRSMDPDEPNFTVLKGILEKNVRSGQSQKKTYQSTEQEIQGIRKVQQVSYRNMLDDQIRQKQQFDSLFGLQNPIELRKLVKSELKNSPGLLSKQKVNETQRGISPHMIPSQEISYAQLAKTDRRLNKSQID